MRNCLGKNVTVKKDLAQQQMWLLEISSKAQSSCT
jgi:hypothetical protein